MWTKDEILDLLKNNKQAVLRAIIVLYNRQTELEKEFKESNVVNGIGFTCKDSWYLSSLARQLIEYKKIANEDFWRARWRIFKYANQLTYIANENEQRKECIQKIHDILYLKLNREENKWMDKKS